MFHRNERLFLRYREARDARALGLVFDRTAPELLRVARHLTKDLHRAEDLVQATFLTAMERASQYDPRRPLLPWLLTILANRAREWHRREQLARRTAPAASADRVVTGDVVEQVATRELARECDRALDALAEPYRHVLILHLRHHLAGVEIAAALDRPDSTVRNQIARGMDLLRRSLPAWTAPAVAVTTATATAGRSLAAIRRAVLAREVGVPTGVAVTGTSLLVLGGVSMGSKVPALAVVVVGLALAGSGTWYLQSAGGEAMDHAVADSGPLHGETAGGGSASVGNPPAESEAIRTPMPDPAKAPGSLRVEVVLKGSGAPAAGLPFQLIRHDDRSTAVAAGKTAADGLVAAAALAPGKYALILRQGSRSERAVLEVRASEQSAQRLEIEPGWELTGLVVDPGGQPVGGATVRARDHMDRAVDLVRSGPDGSFHLPHLREDITLWAMAPGRQPSQRQGFEARQGSAKVRLVVGEPGCRLTGIVEDEEGRSVARAQVVLGVPKPISSPFVQYESHLLRAGPDGRFEVDWLPPGRHFVGALPADGGAARGTGRWVETVGSGEARLTLRLGDGACLMGQVRDEATGKPVAGATITASMLGHTGIQPFESALDSGRAVTGKDGRYEIAGLVEGRYRVRAQKDAVASKTELAIERSHEHRWDTLLDVGRSLTVRLLDREGNPLRAWFIQLRRRDPVYHQVVDGWDFTDSKGRAEFENLRPAAYEVLVRAKPSSPPVLRRQGMRPSPPGHGATELVLRLDPEQIPEATITGRVVDGAGRPVLDAKVSMNPKGGGYVRHLVVQQDGSFKTDVLPAGVYSLSARRPDAGPYSHVGGAYEVSQGQHLDIGDLVLAEPACLTVRLVAPDGGSINRPVLRLGKRRETRPASYDLTRDVVDGVYRTERIGPGQYVLRFFGADAVPEVVDVQVAAGQTRQIEVRIQRGRPVVLEVRFAPHNGKVIGALCNGLLAVWDATGKETLVFHSLWGYFEDAAKRIRRVHLALPPGKYRVTAEEFGGKKRETEMQVTAEGPTKPFVIDLR